MIAQVCLQGTRRLSLWARCYCKDHLSNLENVLPSEHFDSRCEGKTIMWYILTNYWVNLSLALRALWQIICDRYICQHTVYFYRHAHFCSCLCFVVARHLSICPSVLLLLNVYPCDRPYACEYNLIGEHIRWIQTNDNMSTTKQSMSSLILLWLYYHLLWIGGIFQAKYFPNNDDPRQYGLYLHIK